MKQSVSKGPLKNFLLFLLLILTTGCGSLTPEGEKVFVTKSKSDVKGCRPITKLEASSFGTGGLLLVGNHNSSIRIRNMAAKYGDTLYMIEDSAHLLGSNRVGIVFRCGKRKDIVDATSD